MITNTSLLPPAVSQSYDFDTLSLGWPEGILLTSGHFSFNIVQVFPILLGSLTLFSEEVMKWASFKMPDLCLPKANA